MPDQIPKSLTEEFNDDEDSRRLDEKNTRRKYDTKSFIGPLIVLIIILIVALITLL